MLVNLNKGNGSSHCINHIEEFFYTQYHYIWGITQSSWLNIKRKVNENGTDSIKDKYLQ